ncbi:MAG: magnesium chelatase subunit D [Burkholderiaceae bacterium]|nr:magnesium chelatase subunit D [Burkholderiaceae bacterium]
MSAATQSLEDLLQDALLAAELFALDPTQLGGMVIKAHAGPVRTRYLEFLKSRLAPGRPFRKLPLSIQDERLIGGLDLAATLNAGRPVLSRGLLADVDNGVLMVPMAERVSPALAARLASVMDRGEVLIAREGLSAEIPAAFGLLLLDESVQEDERAPVELVDRLAFHVDLREVPHAALDAAIAFFTEALAMSAGAAQLGADRSATDAEAVPTAVRLSAQDAQEISDDITKALCATAMALGIDSIRAAIFARRAAELAGRWFGHAHTEKEDAELAARLVLAPRATVIPQAPPEEPEPPEEEPQQQQDDPKDQQQDADESKPQDLENLDDVVLEAAKAAIPAGLLAQLLSDQRMFARASGSGKSGALKKGGSRGRPLGSRQGMPAGRARLSIIDTLRAAAPWQKLRTPARLDQSPPVHHGVKKKLHIRSEDFRIKRFKEKSETTTIFVVDASGSSAIHRLAEAKGAVELLLADCYVRRDQVAVIAFRGKQAEVILPPTRSLVRAKRSLSGLPGGGGTPLAMALEACQLLAEGVKRRGETPVVVMLTDGKANINREGNPGREQAQQDALHAARHFAAAGVAAMVIDTSPQPSQAAQLLSKEMRARYMPLPYAGAVEVSQAVKMMV